MISEEGRVAGGPEDERRDERVAAENLRAKKEGGGQGEKRQRVEDVADPETIGDGGGDDGEGGGRSHAGVGVGAEEITVVG